MQKAISLTLLLFFYLPLVLDKHPSSMRFFNPPFHFAFLSYWGPKRKFLRSLRFGGEKTKGKKKKKRLVITAQLGIMTLEFFSVKLVSLQPLSVEGGSHPQRDHYRPHKPTYFHNRLVYWYKYKKCFFFF